MKKTNKKTAVAKFNARTSKLIAGAAVIGFNTADTFGQGVALFAAIGDGNDKALDAAARQYKIGYVARSMSDLYAKRWGNMDQAQRFAEAELILAKGSPDSAKTDRRTDAEHNACRSADNSISRAKRKAGIAAKKTGGPRKARPGSNKKTAPKTIVVDMVKACPTLKGKAAVNDYFASSLAALLGTCNKNAKDTIPAISSAISDCHAALVAAGVIVKAS